ncbi:Deleted in malignant brain tumors 1 protein, partial [Nibea albiflora]
CDDDWDLNDAQVVCRQLDCGTALSVPQSAHFGQGTGQIWLDDVACSGNESSLTDCQHGGFGQHNCNHSQEAGVICSGTGQIWLNDVACSGSESFLTECQHGGFGQHNCGHSEDAGVICSDQIRLSGSGSTLCSGRVEIYHNNVWGTVCDDDWDLKDAQVVCRQLDCGTALSGPESAHFGHGTGQIWLDDVACSGSESSLTECQHRGFGQHDCNHGEDVGVICSVRFPKPNISVIPVAGGILLLLVLVLLPVFLVCRRRRRAKQPEAVVLIQLSANPGDEYGNRKDDYEDEEEDYMSAVPLQQRVRVKQPNTKRQSEWSPSSDSSDDEEPRYWLRLPVRRGLENTQVRPVCEPQGHSNQQYNHVTTTEKSDQTRALASERETRRSVHVSERGESLPDVESRETGQRTHEEEGVEEEYLPIEPMPAHPGQEATTLVTPQTGSEQPNDDQATHPQIRRSSRERKPTQTLTYQTLGRPSYQPRTICNAVGAYGLPAIPTWGMPPYPMTHHTPFQAPPYHTLYQILPHTSHTQFTAPLVVY